MQELGITDFLSIEERLQWKLNAGSYRADDAVDVQDALTRIKGLSENLFVYNTMMNRAMDERRVVLTQTQILNTQNMQYEKQITQLRLQLAQIGTQALEASNSKGMTTESVTANHTDQVPICCKMESPTAGPAAGTKEPAAKLFLRINFGDSACGADEFPYSWLQNENKKDKTGAQTKGVLCPNCSAVFIDKGAGVKDCGIQSHLTKFKCPRLKHLRPGPDDEHKPKQKKRKKSADAAEAEPVVHVDDESVDGELRDLVVRVTSSAVTCDSGDNSDGGGAVIHTISDSAASSVQNIDAVSAVPLP